MGHATLHLPPEHDSAPAHKKALRRLSICLIARSDKQQAMLRCTGIADNVTLVNSTLPAFVRWPDFQVGILDAMASISGCSTPWFSLLMDSGIPRYLQGKDATVHGNTCWNATTVCSSPQIGVATHLSKLVTRPDAPASNCRIWLRQCRSSGSGAVRTTRSRRPFSEPSCELIFCSGPSQPLHIVFRSPFHAFSDQTS